MITLNLIPNHDKQELRLLNVFLAVKNIVSLGLIGLITLAVGLIATKVFLQNYFTYLTASNNVRLQSSRNATSELRSLKTELATLQGIQLSYVPWSQLLLRLNQEINEGIMLTDLTITADGNAELSGVAQRREDLLRLHDQLVSSGLTKDFSIPLATKFQEADIKFRLPLAITIPRLQAP